MHTRQLSIVLFAALIVSMAGSVAASGAHVYAGGGYELRHKLKPYAEFLADVADRPRRVIYTPYPVSAQEGLVRGFVHVSDGTSVLSRTDLVVDASLPIVIRRAYHSARTRSGDFGVGGWHLTIAERIDRRADGSLDYTYGNGTTLALDPRGRMRSPLQAYLSDVAEVHPLNGTTIEVRTRTGLLKRFRRASDRYRLIGVADTYGNALALSYAPNGALSHISASSGAWVDLRRDDLGRIRRAVDSNGRSVGYAYDAAGRLSVVTDPGKFEWVYGYDAAHRLVTTATPNGVTDTEFEFDEAGRVRASRANGARHGFSYEGSRTVVTDSRGLATTFSAAPSGLTVAVANSLGTTTSTALDASGRPRALLRNGTLVAEFAAGSADGQPAYQASFSNPGGANAYRIRYDALGRVVSVSSETDGLLYEVIQYGPGLIAERVVYADQSEETAQFDARGELRRLGNRDGGALTFERSGRIWRIQNEADRKIELRFNAFGRIASARTPDGRTLEFGYNDLGLRETTRASYGTLVRYQYDASGSLFHSQVSDHAVANPAYTYVLGADQRVDAVAGSDGTRTEFRYDEKGGLEEVRAQQASELKFEYDELSRLKRVQYEDEAPLQYEYAQGEPDIVSQLTVRALPVFNQQKEISDFGPRFDIVLTRVRPAALGLLTFDEAANELTIAADPTTWRPTAFLTRSISALKIEALMGEDPRGIPTFVMPSNRLFVPAEYWSVNCCMCFCPDPTYTCYLQ